MYPEIVTKLNKRWDYIVEINVKNFLSVLLSVYHTTSKNTLWWLLYHSIPGRGQFGLLVTLHTSWDANPQQKKGKQLGEHALGHLSAFLATTQDSNGLGGLENRQCLNYNSTRDSISSVHVVLTALGTDVSIFTVMLPLGFSWYGSVRDSTSRRWVKTFFISWTSPVITSHMATILLGNEEEREWEEGLGKRERE